MFLRSTKFCQGLPYFEDAVVLPRSRTNFCQAWNLTDLSICTPWFEGNVNQENLISIFSRSISIRSPPKLFLSYAAIKRWKIEDSYLGMLHNNLRIQLLQFTLAKVVDSTFFRAFIFICVQSMVPAMFDRSENSLNIAMEALVSCDWHMLLTNIFLCLSAPTLDKLKIWQRQILSKFLVEPNKFCQSSAFRPSVKLHTTCSPWSFNPQYLTVKPWL